MMDLDGGDGSLFFHGAGDLCKPVDKAVIIYDGLVRGNHTFG